METYFGQLPRAITKREATAIIEYAWNELNEYQITDAWYEAIERYLPTVRFENDIDFVENEFQKRLRIVRYKTYISQFRINQQLQFIPQQQLFPQQQLRLICLKKLTQQSHKSNYN